ncbi:MAG: lipid-A-disaccharide synthase N-terminal domain-containing protein [Candidatus Micrarchaeota archaeon]
MDWQLAGVAGMALVVVAWIPETLETIRKGRADVPLAFAAIYGVGSALLLAYALAINDFVFSLLNGAALLAALINLFYCLRQKH